MAHFDKGSGSEHLELQTDRHNGDGGSVRREYDDDDDDDDKRV